MYAVIKHKYFNTTIRTDKRISSLKINENDILSIIKSLNSNKSHGCNKLSIKRQIVSYCPRNKFSSFDCDPSINVSGVFLDCPETFEKEFKLTTYCVNDKMLTLMSAIRG